MTAPDIERMLRRVVLDVLDEDVEKNWLAAPEAPHAARVALRSEACSERGR